VSDKKIHYQNESGTIAVSDTLLTFNGGHYPIRNISSVKLKTGFPIDWMPLMKKAGIGLSIVGLFAAIVSSDATALALGIIVFLCWFFNPVWIEISSSGTKEFINKASARTSYEGTIEIFEAINKSLRDIQDS
jgi:hypothetical protein